MYIAIYLADSLRNKSPFAVIVRKVARCWPACSYPIILLARTRALQIGCRANPKRRRPLASPPLRPHNSYAPRQARSCDAHRNRHQAANNGPTTLNTNFLRFREIVVTSERAVRRECPNSCAPQLLLLALALEMSNALNVQPSPVHKLLST